MRSAELLVGALLVATAALSPLLDEEIITDVADVYGNLLVDHFTFNQTATVTAEDAVARVEGPVRGQVAAPQLTMALWEITYVYEEREEPLPRGQFAVVTQIDEQVYGYRNASLGIHGTTRGVLQTWPGADGVPPVFGLDTFGNGESQIAGSRYTTWLQSPISDHSYTLEAPLLGLAHDGSEMSYKDVRLIDKGNVLFGNLSATGGLEFVIEDADVLVTHDGGQDSIKLRSNVTKFTGAPLITQTVTTRFAVVTVDNGTAEIGFDDTRAIFLARDPALVFNGTLTLDAQTGSVRAGERQRTVDDERVTITGRTAMQMRIDGDPDGRMDLPAVYRVGSVLPVEDPETHSDLHSGADSVYIGDETFVAASSTVSRALPEEVTLAAQIGGALLVAWGVGRFLVVFFAGMVAAEPLKHPRRRRIYAMLQELGLAHVRDLHRRTGIPLGSLVYHLDILRQARLVCSAQRGGFRVYYIPSPMLSRTTAQSLAVLADDTRRRLCRVLLDEGPRTHQDLGKRLALSGRQVSRHLAVLRREDLVVTTGTRRLTYAPSDLLRRWDQRVPTEAPADADDRPEASSSTCHALDPAASD